MVLPAGTRSRIVEVALVKCTVASNIVLALIQLVVRGITQLEAGPDYGSLEAPVVWL
jgi:DNA-binding TFAR19-related protein (PDSD5 family)